MVVEVPDFSTTEPVNGLSFGAAGIAVRVSDGGADDGRSGLVTSCDQWTDLDLIGNSSTSAFESIEDDFTQMSAGLLMVPDDGCVLLLVKLGDNEVCDILITLVAVPLGESTFSFSSC